MYALAKDLQPDLTDPLVRNEITTPDGIKFSVSCFAGEGWSLRNMYEPQDAYKHADFALQLANAFMSVGAEDVYAPTPGFNGEVVLRSDLSTMIRLPHERYLYRNPAVPADACHLSKRGDAGVFSAGGCGIVLAAYGQDLIFAHAGRETILDRLEILTHGKEKNRQRTFVDNLLSGLGGENADPKKLHVWPMYFMGPDEFVHHLVTNNPDHSLYSRSAREYLPQRYPGKYGWKEQESIGIDLARILQTQLLERGVPSKNVHMEHYRLHRALPTTRNGGGAHGRYLVVAVRHNSPK